MRRIAVGGAQASVSYAALLTLLLVSGCAVGPDYSPPPAPVSPQFKELKGWKIASPIDGADRGDWWVVYRDPRLSELLRQVEISNQTVAEQAAAYEQARAIIREGQAALFPTVTNNYSVTRTRVGSRAVGTGFSGGSGYSTTYQNQTAASWDLDVWGKVRRQIESETSAAQATAADLANAKLSAQGSLATAYFNLRAADSLLDLLERTVVEYKKTLNIVQNQFNAGFSVTAGDVATARAQVETTQAQALAVAATRAQFEHSIAMLIGRAPAELSIGRRLLTGNIPKVPVMLPSTLLERRPDIAAAERTMQEQNALIGVAIAAYFPDISLSGLLQFTSNTNPLPFSAPLMVWSLGATASQTLFNGGLTAAQVDAARAVYWGSVASYRQTVLTALQQVEDELAAIRYYSAELVKQRAAVRDQRQAVQVYLNQFQAGTTAFTTVVTAEVQLLADEENELTTRQNLFLASVALIQALGGGWDATLIPTRKELESNISLLPVLPPNPQ
jgi:NodT family efflux transporter outer membrane factor (OMF) lipoprotein